MRCEAQTLRVLARWCASGRKPCPLGLSLSIFKGKLSFSIAEAVDGWYLIPDKSIKILIIQFSKKKIRYYKKFLLVLKEAEIERNNM